MENAILGAFLMLLYGALCYAIAKAKTGEEFTPIKLAKTVVIGFIVGAFSSWLGLPPEQLETMTFTGFLSIVVDKLTGLLLPAKAPS